MILKELLLYYILMPLMAGIICSVPLLFNLPAWLPLILGPGVMILLQLIRRRKRNMLHAVWINGILLVLLAGVFTALMILSRGELDGVLVSAFQFALIPFFPLVFLLPLMGGTDVLFLTAFLCFFSVFAVSALLHGTSRAKKAVPVLLVLLLVLAAVNGFFYLRRPSVTYGGHGFKYMNGYSSTDFKNYTVYAKHSKLVTLKEEASLIIEEPSEMPVMDGAEACYPVYAALAKACYKNIDAIESDALEDPLVKRRNGAIVSFTNTIYGFMRLIEKGDPEDPYSQADLFFGARPSADQLAEARRMGVPLEVTPIGREAFVFFAEKDNPVENLTSDQIKAIYHGDITNWSQVGGKDEPILAFQRPANSGSQTMMEYFMGNVSLKEPLSYETVSSMEGVITHVAQYNNEAGALGYTFRYFLEELNQEKGVHMISVDGVYPSLENIKNGSYPLTTSLCVISREKDPNPNVGKMIDFILSDQGQYIIEQTGYAPL